MNQFFFNTLVKQPHQIIGKEIVLFQNRFFSCCLSNLIRQVGKRKGRRRSRKKRRTRKWRQRVREGGRDSEGKEERGKRE